MSAERLTELVDGARVVVVVGAGGVGKTTTAAALGVAAARRGRSTLVLTVDPARRLADALGLGPLGGEIQGVDLEGSAGELSVAMLDADAAWRDVVVRYAPDEATREALLANPLFRTITGRFVHAQHYAAIERLEALRRDDRFALVVIDTPPSLHAVDFLDAPRRMAEFFDSRLLRWLTLPARSRAVGGFSRPFLVVADRLLGRRFLRDIADLFALLQRLQHGFTERARAVAGTLADPGTGYVLVTAPEVGPVADARALIAALEQRRLPAPVVVANRTTPAAGADGAAPAVARIRGERAELRRLLGVAAGDPGDRLLDGLAALHAELVARRAAETAALAGLGAGPGGGLAPVLVPELTEAPTDVPSLDRLATLLLEPGARPEGLGP